MGADFYSSELYWNNLKPLDFEKGRQTAESIDDIEEKEKIIALIEKFEGYDLEGNFYHREGSITEVGSISILIAAYQGHGDPSECNSLMADIDRLLEQYKVMQAIGFTHNPKLLFNQIKETEYLRGIMDASKNELDIELYSTSEIADSELEKLVTFRGGLGIGLANLTDRAAEILSKYQGDLYLWELVEISDYAAEQISNIKGDVLAIGINTITDSVADRLSKYNGNLYFDDLDSISDTALEILASHKGTLGLDGLSDLSPNSADILSRHKAGLSLNGLTSLSADVAVLLANHRTDMDSVSLYLNGLTELSDEIATELAKHVGYLSLDGISSMSVSVAEILSSHEGRIDLGGLVEADQETWDILRNSPQMHLPDSETEEDDE